MSTSAQIYHAASQFLGVSERKGGLSHPLILAWIKQAASWLDPDDSITAWCGCFRGHVGLLTGTGVPPAHYRAASWAKWGKPVDVTKPETWHQGDTIVMTRPGGNHVCLFHAHGHRGVECLGGNQSDAVSIATFPLSRVTHVRRLS